MDATDLAFSGAAHQACLIASGEVSAREVVDAVLRRIERLDPALNAFRVVLSERAVAEAQQADARRRAGEARHLLGVPVAIKDDTDVAGVATARGTAASDLTPRDRDAEVVRRLRAAGAVVVGKTNVPELMMWPFSESVSYGAARNPWGPDRPPGGPGGGGGARRGAQPVGARPHAGRLERRVGRGGRGRPVRRRARHRRRRVDSHPGGVLRRVRHEAAARSRAARPGPERRLARPERRRPARANG